MDRSQESLAGLCPVGEPEWQPPPWPKDCPQPGIYEGLSYEQYRAWPAVNATCLKAGVELSAKHMRQSLVDGSDSQDRRFGRAFHCLLLEGLEAFAKRFPVATDCTGILTSGKRKGQPCGSQGRFRGDLGWYCGTHMPPEAVEPADYVTVEQADRMARAVEAVCAHPSVKLIREHGGVEVSLVWERDGIPCKARLDKLIDAANCPDTIIDAKKVQAYQISEKDLDYAIRKYLYDVQAFWYTDGMNRLTGKDYRFLWVFAEDGPPYDVVLRRADKREVVSEHTGEVRWVKRGSWTEMGAKRMRRAFETYKWCLTTDVWKGVADDITSSEPPKWLWELYL